MNSGEMNLFRGLCLLTLLFATVSTPSTAQYAVTRSVLDMAGGVRISASYRLVDACGQTAADVSASPSYILKSGFLALGLLPTGIEGPETHIPLPRSYVLEQNYPNPFNPSTTIRYDIPESAGQGVLVRLDILNMRGQRIRTLVDDLRGPGSYTVHWDGRSDRGERVGSGIYFYRIVTDRFTTTRKMTVLK